VVMEALKVACVDPAHASPGQGLCEGLRVSFLRFRDEVERSEGRRNLAL